MAQKAFYFLPTETVYQNEEVIALSEAITKQVKLAILDCIGYLEKYKSYDYIWLENKDVYLKQFIHEWTNYVPNESEETDLEEQENEHDPDLKLESFQNQVSSGVRIFRIQLVFIFIII